MSSHSLLEVNHLVQHFPVKRGALSKVQAYVRAVDGVRCNLAGQEALGLVGESGCGKSTTGRGCRFHMRCTYKEDPCVTEPPVLRETGSGHFVACHFPGNF